MHPVQRYFIRSKVPFARLFWFIIMTSIFFTGCAQWFGFPAYFDATTYKNLTDLKPQVLVLYDTFTTNDLEKKKIESVQLKLAQMYEYEKGKGAKNFETTQQIEIIKKMFERHVNDRQENGIWTETHAENTKENISEAFDIAISTESLKNKNE